MKPIVLVGPGSDVIQAQRIMAQRRPELTFCRPEDAQAQQAQVAISWSPPAGSFAQLPELRLIHSVGAGADRILAEPSRLPHIPVCRIVDPLHCQGMLEYVVWGVLHYHRHFDVCLRNQHHCVWDRQPQRAAQQTRVGVMGLGQLGKAVAQGVAKMGFDTRGWSRSLQTVAGVQTYSAAQLAPFLSALDILICLLPLTPDTQGILCRETFNQLSPGAAVINCGRGGHLREGDVIEALHSGQLRGALLDVFTHEPLPQDHPLWQTPGVTVTPHMASSASFEVIAEQILANIDRLQAGLPLANTVDTTLGY